ncbi:MAG TPA: glycosyltransferase family 87 protein [Anaerolineales bacterium]|nr:glycosyltransferase family 87 protein [Anaerolineales bacterium]
MSRRLRIPLVVGLTALLLGTLAWALREVYTQQYPGGNDLYPRWSAGCDWLTRGIDPYSESATLEIQQGIYGRPAFEFEDQVAFAYPIYSAAIIWPLCLTSDFATAHAVAMVALIAGVIGTAILSRQVSSWRPAGWLWVWALFWIVVSYPSARAVLLGQLAVMVGLVQVAALEGLRTRRDVLAGIALAVSMVKPQMAILLVPGLLFWAVWTRRWQFVGAFTAAMAVLVLVPMAWLPSWIGDWIGQLRVYPSYTEFGSATWILTTYYLGTPPLVELVLTAGLVVGVGYVWWVARRARFEMMVWAAALTIVLTHFISPRTATTHFGPMLVPAFMMFRVTAQPEGRARPWAVAGFLAAVSVLSWVLFLLTVDGRQESALNYLPVPIGMLLALIWIRRPWHRLQGASP